MNSLDDSKLEIMREVLNMGAEALSRAANRLSDEEVESLSQIFEKLINLGGKLIFCGVGKSGYIARKLSSTFASLGLPGHFLHPTEALHGDLGNIRKIDSIVFISKSGNTEEILKLMPYIAVEKNMRIGLLGSTKSPIAKEVSLVLDCSVNKEACLNNQAPTTSSLVALGMGDAMGVLYEQIVGLSKEGFASNHPGGLLGKSLHMKVSHLMMDIKSIPVLSPDAPLKDVIIAMTEHPVGGCAILSGKTLAGIIVEGDIRRSLNKDETALNKSASEIMNSNPVTIHPDSLAYDGLKLMESGKQQISILPVVDKNNNFLGLLRLHDLLKEGLVVN